MGDRFFFHWELFGFWNRPSGKLIALSALAQAFCLSLIIIAVGVAYYKVLRGWFGGQNPIFNGFEPVICGQSGELKANSNGGTDQQAFLAFLILLVSSFGAIYWQELGRFYAKWAYLAALFNRVIEIDPAAGAKGYRKREHLNACMASDMLVMGMWAHKSFRESFRDLLEKAVLYRFRNDISLAQKELEAIANHGLPYRSAKEFIGDYIEYLLADEDRPSYLLNSIPRGY